MTTKQPLTVEYLRKQLGVCWSDSQLQAAAAQWPNGSPSWSWWFGDRLANMTRAQVLERWSVAVNHIHMQRLEAPARAGDLWRWAKGASDAQLQTGGAALGAWLDTDSPDAARQLLATMRGELGAAQAGVIEAVPSSSSSEPDTAPPAADASTTASTTPKRRSGK